LKQGQLHKMVKHPSRGLPSVYEERVEGIGWTLMGSGKVRYSLFFIFHTLFLSYFLFAILFLVILFYFILFLTSINLLMFVSREKIAVSC
jgi:hypothetical protein